MLRQSPTGLRDPVEDAVPPSLPPDDPEESHPSVPPASLTSPLRRAGYAMLLVALCFVQDPGRMVADTKFDLLTAPWRFLERGMHLWDPNVAFGQVPDQSYGYAWPMGPFFGVGALLELPPWVVQRLWWSLLICLAFFGMLRLCERLGLGTELTRVVAAFAFVLTPRLTTLVGVVSVEVWPMALAPWVLLPLVKGSQQGSVRRAAATSALVVACCGGVNAVAVAAVLPLGVVWLLTRSPGPRRWRLLGWWTGLTILATAWWSGPLLLMGSYSPPFLDYIENATITTLSTDLTRSLLGVSDWVAYFGGQDFGAGRQIVGTPFLLLDAALVAAVGLVGIGMRDNPHRRFLVLGLLTGLALVGLGYSRDLAGFFAESRLHSLDNALAALRNLHKFDVVLRIPLLLGLAHGLARLPELLRGRGSALARLTFRAAMVLAMVGLLSPWLNTVISAHDGVKGVPRYWQQAADYLAAQDDGSVALELPAASFGVYGWGNVHDDVLQGLATSPWAVRSVVPLAQPGNVVFLDAVTRAVESGRPSPQLAAYLAANNVGTLVVRNDLDRLATGAPDPAYVRSVLGATPGIELEKSFGPTIGAPPYAFARDADHTRLVTGSGISERTRPIEIYRVSGTTAATVSDPGRVLVGDPGSPIGPGAADLAESPHVLAADATVPVTGQVLTDDMSRQEMNFPAVRWNESSTLSADEPFRLPGKEQSHRVVDDEERWSTVESWTGGVDRVSASSSQAYADATPPLSVGAHPGAVFDSDSSTAWESARDEDPGGQWWQAHFPTARTVGTVALRLAPGSVRPAHLRISGGGQTRTVNPPAPGSWATYQVGLPRTHSLRVTTEYAGPLLTGSVAISDLSVDDLHPQRFLDLPAPLEGAPVNQVVLSRDQDRLPCAQVRAAFKCDDILIAPGEDGDTLARRFQLSAGGRYRIGVLASLRRHPDVWKGLLGGTGVAVSATPQRSQDPAESPGAMVDGDPATTWESTVQRPLVRLTLPRPTRLSTLRMTLRPGAAASRPARVEIWSRQGHRVLDLDKRGRAKLPHWKVTSLRLRIDSTYPAFADQGDRYVELGPGVTELRLNGRRITSSVFRTVTLPCGQGPRFYLGGSLYDTSVTANVRDLVRGKRVAVQVCAPDAVNLAPGRSALIAPPTSELRVDAVTLTRAGTSPATAQDLEVDRDASGAPASVDVASRSRTRLLTLPQNINPGWQATLDGKKLTPQRVDGWKQGWLLPAGDAGTVRLHYAPGGLFDIALLGGAALLLLVVLAALPLWRRRRRPELPPHVAGRPGVIDVVVVGTVAALLTGWVGLGLVGVLALLARRWGGLGTTGGWGLPAAAALLLAVAGLTWGPLKDQSWALTWAQLWAMAAVAALSVSLVGPRRPPRPGRAASRPVPDRPPSARS